MVSRRASPSRTRAKGGNAFGIRDFHKSIKRVSGNDRIYFGVDLSGEDGKMIRLHCRGRIAVLRY
tara:strand:- start:97 stop:291 length:195 start_codon:yes stop_codon:yes gene_type:complete